MSFLEVFDRAAGATKSGGTTRRAAKMVCLDMDHPEIESFADYSGWKAKLGRVFAPTGWSSPRPSGATGTTGVPWRRP